jgi:Ca-activated chloride channel family protein
MLIKVNSVNHVSESNFLNHLHLSYVEVRQMIKLLSLIVGLAFLAPSLFMFYQILEAKPIHINANNAALTTININQKTIAERQHLPSFINKGNVEMGPFLVPIINAETIASKKLCQIKGELMDNNKMGLVNGKLTLYKGFDSIASTVSIDQGYFYFKDIKPGKYYLTASLGGYKKQEYVPITLISDSVNYILIKLELISYNVGYSTSCTIKSKTLIRTGKRGNNLAGLSSGVTNSSGGLSGRGSRSMPATAYFVDGVRVFNSNLGQDKTSTGIKLSQNTTAENTESYASLIENEYQNPFNEPLSTFSIDVDNASYTNTRRMLQANTLPPKDAVRIEEFVNYFDYKYPAPETQDPFSINLEMASSPWNKETKIVSIGLKGKDIERKELPKSNLVFLIDVSGSMQVENKLPLVKQALNLLIDQMRPDDNIAIVTYAGAAGLALGSTPCSKKDKIKAVIDRLEAGGSTAGGQGIELAYIIAKESMVEDGNNRIILVTDGDFNVGVSSDGELKQIIEQKRKDGIYLTVCGFGMGNYKDSKMETLADYGNGNYYYIDAYNEAKKVFSTGLTGTLYTIAKDVKIQVEFNPKFVKAYRLIGYENRKLANQDFENDAKDAGELGAGHTVTAMYEIIPVGSSAIIPGFTELKYQESKNELKDYGDELLTVKMRYKNPADTTSKLIFKTLNYSNTGYEIASNNFRYACGVVMFGMLLRDSKFKAEATYEKAEDLLESSKQDDINGYKAELITLIEKAKKLTLNK